MNYAHEALVKCACDRDNKWVKLGQQIKEIRLKRGLTQEDLAERSGLGVSHIARLEQGRRKATIDTLQKIADVLGVQVKDLIPF